MCDEDDTHKGDDVPLRFLYNDDPGADEELILAFLDGLASKWGGDMAVDTLAISSLCVQIQTDFPHRDGLEKASVFKKMANFILWFADKSPIAALPSGLDKQLPEVLRGIRNYQNVLVALLIALDGMMGAELHRRDQQVVTVTKPIQLSGHSIIDIIDAISKASPSTGFNLLTVLLEQMVYKTNPHCQYDLIELP